MNRHHHALLAGIRDLSGTPTQHTFLDNYLGNNHPRYPISAPLLRKIAKEWMREHRDLDMKAHSSLLTSLVKGKSSTEKCMAGILLDCASADQRKFDPVLFDDWLDYLEGWAEIDSLCTGKYSVFEIPLQWKKWKPLLLRFSKSKNINKRRASLVFFCSPLRNVKDDRLADVAFGIVDALKHEKEILITKAISWVLRSMEKRYRGRLEEYINQNKGSLPKIAVRETLVKLATGVKNKRTLRQKIE